MDNPLALPHDSELISYHLSNQSDATIKCVKRLHPKESMGGLIEREGRLEIVEYIDLDPSLSYPYANTGIMAISLPFLAKMAKIELPLHFVQKQFKGQPVLKGEKFIFDALSYAPQVKALCFPRELCYAPLKDSQSLGLEVFRMFF